MDTIPARLFEQARVRASKPAYYAKEGGRWKPTTWATYAVQVRQVGKALLGCGVGAGDTIGILGFNRPEWLLADLGVMCIGGAPAGIYTTCSPSEVQYILSHAASKVCVVENAAQWDKIAAVRAQLPALAHVVLMKGAPAIADPLVLTWEQFLARANGVDDRRFDEALAALSPGDLATLIYTSGTTGPPKGVMLSHDNLAWTSKQIMASAGGEADDRGLSYLPLSHIAEQMTSIHGPITSGAAVYFAESIDKVADNVREVRPTIMFGVPRIWEKFHAGIAAKLDAATGVKAELLAWARGVATQVAALRNRGREPHGLLAVQYKLADKLVFSKLKAAIGLDRGRRFISGAAPIAKEVLEFFASLDIIITEVYGQSEDTGPTSYNMEGRTKFGTVGPALAGVEVKIADDGEILVKGRNVFLGYYKDPAATAETLIDGWLHSGDLGAFDAEGFLTITGRKKDIIITAGGKNIAPKNLEASLKNHPLISEAVVIGDRRKYLTALVTLDDDAARKFCADHGLASDAPHTLPQVVAELQRAVDDMNRDLAQVETVKKFTILPRQFTIDDGELTPTLKVKRRVVSENFARQIEAMYA